MKTTNYFILIFTALCFSCKSEKTESQEKVINDTKHKVEMKNEEPINQLDSSQNDVVINNSYDSILRFYVDDYPITNDMIRKQSGENHLFKIRSGKTLQ